MGRALALDEVGVPADGFGDRVGKVLFVLRGCVGVGKQPASGEEGAVELEGELRAAGGEWPVSCKIVGEGTEGREAHAAMFSGVQPRSWNRQAR